MKEYTFDFYNTASLKSYNLTDTMKFQLSILDRMEPFTKKHSENVANLVCRICEYLHFNSAMIVDATMNAYLHDVGKLMIPPEILNKPGKLTDEEFEIMKTHTTKGYEICMKHPELRPFAQTALCHHEALNGTGYPNGLTKKDIPYKVQITRVADEYDAIVTKRQYKTHVNISETLRDLIKDASPEEYTKAVALDQLNNNQKLGKINPKVLKVLFKVVLDDTFYEIETVQNYIRYLKSEIKRLHTIEEYYHKMETAKKEKDKGYFAEGIKLLLASGETIDNFRDIFHDYQNSLTEKEHHLEQLYEETKIIKKLKI